MGKDTVAAICLGLVVWLLGGVWPAGAQSGALRGQDHVVHALWFSQGQERCNGGTSPVYLRLERNPLDYIQVGFFESSAGAVGEMWRTAGWMAALVSTTLLGQDLHTHRISYTVEGLIDGPSAGALMTSGLLALMRGVDMTSDVKSWVPIFLHVLPFLSPGARRPSEEPEPVRDDG